jgi:hypothetical protein
LNQLSTDWEEEYDTIAALLAQELVVYVDETGSVDRKLPQKRGRVRVRT